MAVKVFKNYASSLKELEIAQEICSFNFKGLAVLEDDGIIDEYHVAEDLGALPNSIFIVYRYIEHCLKSLWIGQNKAFSMQDTVQIGV